MEIKNYSVLISFIAGVLSFTSPCILPLIPAYISYITGVSVEDLKKGRRNLSNTVLLSLFFIGGFTLIFTLLGASATYIGKFLMEKKDIIRIAGSIVIIIFGLHLTGILRIKKLYTEKKFRMKEMSSKYLSSFLFGVIFSLGWTPCVGPVLSSILIMASMEEKVIRGIILLFFYSVGIGIPFLITAILLNRFLLFFSKLRKHYHKIEIITGLLLVAIGILLLLDKFTFTSF